MAATPGWYADPAGGGGKRYWDGQQWIAFTPTSSSADGNSRRVALMFIVLGILMAGGCVAVATVAIIGNGSGVSGSGGGPDRLYINKLHVHGLFAATGVDEHDWETQVISAAHTVCDGLQVNPREDMVFVLERSSAHLTAHKANTIVNAAIDVYCPQYK